jgi:hypothetical protein
VTKRTAILSAYLVEVFIIQTALVVLVSKRIITAGQFLTASTLLLNGLAALMIRFEPKTEAESVEVQGDDVTVTETPPGE